jgi:hypothetical protein
MLFNQQKPIVIRQFSHLLSISGPFQVFAFGCHATLSVIMHISYCMFDLKSTEPLREKKWLLWFYKQLSLYTLEYLAVGNAPTPSGMHFVLSTMWMFCHAYTH